MFLLNFDEFCRIFRFVEKYPNFHWARAVELVAKEARRSHRSFEASLKSQKVVKM